MKFSPTVIANHSAAHVPVCDDNYNPPRCSNLYHDHAQTPGYPHGDGTCTYYSTIPIDLRIHMMCHLSDCKEPTIA